MSARVHERQQRREVVLVRHAQTEWSEAGRHTGRSDVPLTEGGRRAARQLAPRLRGWRFSLVLVSPLARARETCELCGLGAHAQVREDLAEWDYGEYDGLTTAEIRARRPDWDLWRDGAPGGESPAQVGARCDRVVAELRAVRGAAAVFAHGHLLRVLGARWVEQEPALGARLHLDTAALSLLSHERETAVLGSWNT